MPHLNKNVVGYVPAKMTYVQRKPSEVSDYWEHDFWGDEKPPTRTVRETFVVDADNPNTRKTAAEWAGPDAVFTDKPNDPIEEVEVVSLVLRGNGGRAWKVLIDGTFYVDLREDVMPKGRTMAGKVGEVDVSGVFDKIRRIGKDCVEYAVADTTKNIQERRTYGDLNECVLGHMAHHMRLCLMRPTGEPRPDAPAIQKLLDLVKDQLA